MVCKINSGPDYLNFNCRSGELPQLSRGENFVAFGSFTELRDRVAIQLELNAFVTESCDEHL